MNGAPPEIPIHMHPNIPPGVVLFTSSSVPYPLNNIQNIWEIQCRRDYHQYEWPMKTRAYEYGVYTDQVLKHYFPPSMGQLVNVGAG